MIAGAVAGWLAPVAGFCFILGLLVGARDAHQADDTVDVFTDMQP